MSVGPVILTCAILPRPPLVLDVNGTASLALNSPPRPPILPVGNVTAFLTTGGFSYRPPSVSWTWKRPHRLSVGKVDAAAPAGVPEGGAPPRRAH